LEEPLRILLLCLSVLIFLISPLHAQTKEIETEGVASLGNDPAAAHDKAIEDALRRAVEQTVGTIVESESTVENYQLLSDKIYSHSSGYVSGYKVLSETPDGKMLRVKISAEVQTANLQNDLAAIGLLQRRMKYPRVAVMIAEDNVMNTNFWQMYSVSNSQSESTIIARLKEKGFNVVDPGSIRKSVSETDGKAAMEGNNDAAEKVAAKTGAEILIVGQATSNKAADNIAGSDLLSMSSTLNVQAVKAGTGEVIAQASGQGTAAHINEVAALQQSLQKASDEVADLLIRGILDSWQRESSGTRNLVLQLEGASSSDLNKIKTGLERIRGVTEVVVRNFSNGSADLDIQAKTDAMDLSSAISKDGIPGVRLVLLESSADRLQYRVSH
jgi:Flagellar assembly protein T, N-terminal domain